MERATVPALAGNGFRDVLLCPVGHKYEVLGVSVTSTSGHALTWLAVAATISSGLAVNLVSPAAPPANSYFASIGAVLFVLYAGEKLQTFHFPTAGVVTAVVHYIDVDFST